jgi:hypothetical protein
MTNQEKAGKENPALHDHVFPGQRALCGREGFLRGSRGEIISGRLLRLKEISEQLNRVDAGILCFLSLDPGNGFLANARSSGDFVVGQA